MLYPLSAFSVMYILLMYYISLLLLPPDGFVLCYIGLLVLTLWRFDDDVISPSPGTGRYITTLRPYSCSFPCNRAPSKKILSSNQVSNHCCPRAPAHSKDSTPRVISISLRIKGR